MKTVRTTIRHNIIFECAWAIRKYGITSCGRHRPAPLRRCLDPIWKWVSGFFHGFVDFGVRMEQNQASGWYRLFLPMLANKIERGLSREEASVVMRDGINLLLKYGGRNCFYEVEKEIQTDVFQRGIC